MIGTYILGVLGISSSVCSVLDSITSVSMVDQKYEVAAATSSAKSTISIIEG